MSQGESLPPCLYATFRYRDGLKMMDWLCVAFGFSVRAKYLKGDELGHGELALGDSVIMLGQVSDDEFGAVVGTPGPSGGKSIYIAVSDIQAAHDRAKAAGAKILQPLVDREYGSREFRCADPEGNVWSFGTYRPEAP